MRKLSGEIIAKIKTLYRQGKSEEPSLRRLVVPAARFGISFKKAKAA
jgi:hypothetical protein